MRRFAKPLYGLTPVPRVRIPPSPPEIPYIVLTKRFLLTVHRGFASFCRPDEHLLLHSCCTVSFERIHCHRGVLRNLATEVNLFALAREICGLRAVGGAVAHT